MSVCAIVPLRAGSKRVKRKNLRSFRGKPLFETILQTLFKVDKITTILVDTNDEEIKKIIRSSYNNIKLIDRPEELSSEFESINSIINYDLQFIDESLILQTHATNPLLKPESINDAIDRLESNLDQGYDALFSVTREFERFWDADGNPVNHNPNELIRTQDLPPFYRENSCIYLFTKEGFRKANNNRLGTKRIMFELSEVESVDIDYPVDFEFAKLLDKQNF